MIKLLPCPKNYSRDQDKAVLPELTLARVRERLASLSLSVVSETRRIDTNRLGIPVFLSVCGADARKVMPTRKQMGKGASVVQAEASALMELMERYGFFTFWEEKPGAVPAAWSEAEALFGPELMPVEEAVRACHDTLDGETARQLLDLRRWLFFPATRIRDGKTVRVPLDLFKQLGEFNGSSAGNTDTESVFQGACELVERHVCAVVDTEKPVLPTISTCPEDIADPVLADLLEKFRARGIVLALKDFSLGMPVPTVAALAYDPATFPERSEIVYTAGTAASPAKAAIRALTEVAQLAGDFCTSACYEASGLPKYERLEDAAWLLEGPRVTLDALPTVETDDMLDELRALAAGLEKQGFTLYSIATTNPHTQVPSHYSFVPGFRFRERDKNASLGLFVGRMITEQADASTARAALERIGGLCPDAHYLPFFRGLLALRADDPAGARHWFALAEPLQPENEARALCAFYHGYAHMQENDWNGALPGLSRAAALCPDMKEYLNMRGVCLFKQGDHAGAMRDFERILSVLDKGSVMDLYNLGMCHKHLGNTGKAGHYLTAALEIDPDFEAARTHLSSLDAGHS